MSLPRLPGNLPSPLMGFEHEPADNVIRTETEYGAPKYRRRTSSGPDDLVWPMILTNQQKIDFFNFYKNDIADGALSFSDVDPTTKAEVTLHFKSRPKAVLITPDKWRVSAELEMRA